MASYICPHMPLNHRVILKVIRRSLWYRKKAHFNIFRRGSREKTGYESGYYYPKSTNITCPVKACKTRVQLEVFGELPPFVDLERKRLWQRIALIVRRKIGNLQDPNDEMWLAQTETVGRSLEGGEGD